MLDLFYSVAIALLLVFFGANEKNDKVLTSLNTELSESMVATQSATILRVVDGDTVKVQIGDQTETIRIIGINTPETVDPRKDVECFGKEASQFARDFFASSSAQLVLTQDSSQGGRDKYQRLLRYISVSGIDYGASAIANGFAYEYTYDEPYNKQQEYKQLQEKAQKLEVGLWATDACRK